MKFRGAGPFKAGEYDALYENDSMSNVVNRLKKGPLAPRTRELAIPEGLTLAEIKAKILEVFPEMNAADLDAALSTVRSKYQPADSTNLEGLLFPATYQVLESDAVDEQKLVQQMVSKFDSVGDSIGLDQAPAKVGLTPYQVVIEASLIEREAKVPGDRPKIARVIANRLAAKQRLEVDASLEYALGVKGQALNASQLKTDSPFNLRKVAGLPPTPIASPGQASLEAALNPEPGAWLYYVLANADGSHYFTADYNDFLRAKRLAQQQGLLADERPADRPAVSGQTRLAALIGDPARHSRSPAHPQRRLRRHRAGLGLPRLRGRRGPTPAPRSRACARSASTASR